MITKYSNTRYITSAHQLKTLLMKCKYCSKLTMKGELITSSNSLNQLSLPSTPQRKYLVIVHVTPENDFFSSTSKKNSGHWLALACYMTQGKCLIFDPSNAFKQWTTITQSIHEFCIRNRLTEIDFATQCQNEESYVCGEQCLAICAKVHSCNLRQILDLRALLRKYSINSIEHKLVTFSEDHFRTKF